MPTGRTDQSLHFHQRNATNYGKTVRPRPYSFQPVRHKEMAPQQLSWGLFGFTYLRIAYLRIKIF
jgi:hypothetical protein